MFITIDANEITDWPSFHQVFTKALGFPEYYGRNLDAWIDCLSDIHDGEGMCQVSLGPGEMLHLHLTGTSDLNARQPVIVQALIDCTALVNDRFIQSAGMPRLSLVLSDSKVA